MNMIPDECPDLCHCPADSHANMNVNKYELTQAQESIAQITGVSLTLQNFSFIFVRKDSWKLLLKA